VLWVIAAACPLGLLLGLKYKVASLIAASGAMVALTCALSIVAHWTLGNAAVTIVASLIVLQVSYFVGLLISESRGG
jgi:hypothetical protein